VNTERVTIPFLASRTGLDCDTVRARLALAMAGLTQIASPETELCIESGDMATLIKRLRADAKSHPSPTSPGPHILASRGTPARRPPAIQPTPHHAAERTFQMSETLQGKVVRLKLEAAALRAEVADALRAELAATNARETAHDSQPAWLDRQLKLRAERTRHERLAEVAGVSPGWLAFAGQFVSFATDGRAVRPDGTFVRRADWDQAREDFCRANGYNEFGDFT
jgi:hypothetical protein